MLIDEIDKRVLMDEATDPTGDTAGGGDNPTPTPTETPADDSAASADDKPYLGEPTDEGNENESGDQKDAENADKDLPKEDKTEMPSDEDYMKVFVKDEKILGNEEGVELDTKLARLLLPGAKECGLSPNNFAKLGNLLAAAQIQLAKDAVKKRTENIQEMNRVNMRKYTQTDFRKISAGIDKKFKPGGTMNNVIRNTEIGADPEFLALMLEVSESCYEDGATGATSAGGGKPYDPSDISGLAKQWSGN